MQRMLVFLLFIILCPLQLFAEPDNTSVSADSNVELINRKILENEKQFKDLVVEAKKYFKNFDWNGFEDLPVDAQRIVIQNYLAQEAFQEIGDNFKKDIYNRTNNQVEKEHGYYFNSSDKLYRTDYVSENITERAKQQNLLYPTEGTNWFHFKQKDVAALDKIIKEEIEKSPVDMHCEKECIHPRNSADQDWAQKHLKVWKKRIDDYEKKRREFFEKTDETLIDEDNSLKEYEKKYGSTDLRKSFENLRQDQEKRKQEFEKEMIEMRKQYDEAVINLTQKIDIWHLDPYNENCEMVTFACYNVEQIPENQERIQLSISENNEIINHIMYVYDDLNTKQHVESTALKSCYCVNRNTDLDKSVSCNCSLGFYDATVDFDKYRKYENQDRIDIKNGKLQDRTDEGEYLHDWEGNHIPVGSIHGRTFSMYGHDSITTVKDEK